MSATKCPSLSPGVSLASTSRSFMTTLRFEQKPEVATSQLESSTTLGGSGTTGSGVGLNGANSGPRSVSVGSAVAWGTTIEGRRLSEPCEK